MRRSLPATCKEFRFVPIGSAKHCKKKKKIERKKKTRRRLCWDYKIAFILCGGYLFAPKQLTWGGHFSFSSWLQHSDLLNYIMFVAAVLHGYWPFAHLYNWLSLDQPGITNSIYVLPQGTSFVVNWSSWDCVSTLCLYLLDLSFSPSHQSSVYLLTCFPK